MGHYVKFVLGFFCYQVVMRVEDWDNENRLFMWMLEWAGYYAYDDGKDNERLTD